MLEVRAETLSFQGGPDDVLGHAVGMGGPDGELVGVEGELVLHALHDGLSDEEEDLLRVSDAVALHTRVESVKIEWCR